MSLPFAISVGDILDWSGRRIRFEADLGEGDLHLTDVRTGARVRMEDGQGGWTSTTVEWLRGELVSGRIRSTRGLRAAPAPRRGDLSHADTDAVDTVDPKASWRMTWVREARSARVGRSDPACKAFIDAHGQRVSEAFLELKGCTYASPGASTLKKWLTDAPRHYAPEAYVAQAGRRKGQSQLTDREDDIVHKGAIYYWAEPNASVVDAWAHAGAAWLAVPDDERRGFGVKAPSYESVRLRVRRLESYDTVRAKFGKERAERMFEPVGEMFEVRRAFERIFMDGVVFRQACVFGTDRPLPGGRMRGVFAMDALSTFVGDPTVFSGPFREEMSIEALIRMITPPEHLTDEELAKDKHVGWTFGIPEYVTPDNDKTLIGPGYVPALLDLGSRLELPEVRHPNAKSPLEGFFRWIKGRMDGLPGTVLSARQKRDVYRDPVLGAELTAAQHRRIVRSLVWEHNHTATRELGWRSPYEILIASMIAHGVATLEDPLRIRSELAKTVVDKVLTDDGLEHDGIQYRGPEVGDILRRNYHATPHAQRIPGPAKCIVTIRTFAANLDSILVWDQAAQAFVRLYSTQPGYTSELSRWEHEEYRRMAKARKERYETEGQRIRSRKRSLEQIDRDAPKAAFRRRNRMYALSQSEEVRRLSGARAERKGPLELPEHFVAVEPSTEIRGGPGVPPAGARPGGEEPAAPDRRGRRAGRGQNDFRSDEGSGQPDGRAGPDWDTIPDEEPDDEDDADGDE